MMDFIRIGKIVNTFGIKGELKVESYTDFCSERFEKDSIVYVGEEKIPFTMLGYRIHKGYILIKFKDYEDINLVEKYKNMYVYKSKDDIKPLKDGEYYFSDLVGLDVFSNDKIIGTVLTVEEGISSNYLRVKVKDKEKLIPFIPAFIEKVDLDSKKINIKEIEGLL